MSGSEGALRGRVEVLNQVAHSLTLVGLRGRFGDDGGADPVVLLGVTATDAGLELTLDCSDGIVASGPGRVMGSAAVLLAVEYDVRVAWSRARGECKLELNGVTALQYPDAGPPVGPSAGLGELRAGIWDNEAGGGTSRIRLKGWAYSASFDGLR